MSEWPLWLIGGMLGSSHCIGMCGGFAITIGLRSRSVAHNIRRQLAYSSGRIATYTFLGFSAAAFASRVSRSLSGFHAARGVLAFSAGCVLIVTGLAGLGLLSRIRLSNHALGIATSKCSAGAHHGPFKGVRGAGDAFLAGLINGFIPCGLVYGYLALALGSADPVMGAAIMSIFGLGTVPLMLATGAGASFAPASARAVLIKLAAVTVIVTGVISASRALIDAGGEPSSACPHCVERLSSS